MLRKHCRHTCMGLAAWFVGLLAAAWSFGQSPTDFLSRLDANGNGMIDPAEAQGRFGFFLQRIAENNPRIDLSRPIPLSQLQEEFNRMREERMGGGGPTGGGSPGGGPPGGGDRGSDRGSSRGGDRGSDRGRDRGSDESSAYSSRVTTVDPLVPGFGEEDVIVPAPGFGAEAELFSVEVTDADRREAARAFGYYDRNRDGVIDQEEKSRSRYGADLDLYDRNHDGRITLNEMEFRYARRRVEHERDQGRSRTSSSTASRSTDSSGQSRSAFGRGSGTAGFGGGPGGFSRGGDSVRSGGNNDSGRNGSSSNSDQRDSYRIEPVVGRLPRGLPDWFVRNDADADGQIAMHEFSASWSQAVFDDFLQFDLNQDGLITPVECLKAVEKGAQRGTTGSPVVAFGGSSDAGYSRGGSGGGSSRGSSSSSDDESSSERRDSSSSSSSRPVSIDQRYLDYYGKLVGKYDQNGDGRLTVNEWKEMSKDPSAADINGDGAITVEEFTQWSMRR